MSGQNPDNPAAQPALAEASRSGEFDLIARYFAPLAGPGAFGLGDDAAVVTPGAGRQLVFTADAIIAGVHFLDNDPADDVAAKLLAVNLSDVAAMGAAGLGYLVTAAWPRDLEEAWIARFAQGLAEAQAEHGVALLGGDTVATNGPMSLSLTAIGEQPIGAALRRNGARVGDDIYVSGRIGDAGVGLRILRDGLTGGAPAERQMAIDRYRRPRPQLGLGRALPGLASACIDVSDGLIADLGHLAEQSGAAMRIDLEKVPVSPLADLIGGTAAAIVAGDDYELLFTAAPADEQRLGEAAAQSETDITPIGRVEPGQGVSVVDGDGEVVALKEAGYRHF
jgi:thiamine-monophosphate kinase